MPRSFVIAAALATVLTVTACGSALPALDATQAPGAQAPDAADAAEQTAGQPATGASEAGEAAQDGALRSGTLGMTAQADPGEPGLLSHSGASVDDVLRLGAVATWVEAPDVLAISLPATADCWASATEPLVQSADQLSIEFIPGKECGEPDAARTYMVEVPAGIDEGTAIEIEIEGLEHHFTLTLPAR